LHLFLPSLLDGSKWTASHPGQYTPKKRSPGTTEKQAGWSQSKAIKVYVAT